MRNIPFVLALLLVAPFVTDAGVIVRILDTPGNTIPFGPYPVIGAIENVGPGKALVPANRMQILIQSPDLKVWPVPDAGGCSGFDNTVWLKPGERRLFMYDVGSVMSEAGVYRIQAKLYSDGRCRAYLRGNEPFPVVPVFEEGGLPRIECWRGDEVSEAVPVVSIKPSSKLDKDALTYARSVLMPPSVIGKLAMAYPHLRKTFPSSEYTYVAGFWRAATYGGGEPIAHLDEIQRLQPENRLADYVRLYKVLRVIEKVAGAGQVDLRLLSSIAPTELDLPPVLREYVAQVKHDRSERRAYEASLKSPAEAVPVPATTAP